MRGFSTEVSRAALGLMLAYGALASSQVVAQGQEATPQASAGEGFGVEEIVVTAQRRSENLQSVPISVTAITANSLAKSGIGGTTQLNQVIPSVQLTRSGPSTVFFIRGVGNSSGGIGEEGANAFYIDGVYLGDLAQANTEFNNIERIEVLKGPQGTLFGRNSSGGLVNIITRDPGDEIKVKAKAGYGNYKTFSGQLYVAAPLTEKLSADIALTARDQNDGWGRNLFDNSEFGKGWMVGARAKTVWRPGDDTKITWSGDYKKSNDTFSSYFTLREGSVGAGGFTYAGDYNVNTQTPGVSQVKVWGTSLTVAQEFDWATLTSISATRYVRSTSSLDSDNLPPPTTFADVQASSRTYQQELRLASTTTKPLSWQVGAFYYKAHARLLGQTVTGTGVGGIGRGLRIVSSMKTSSLAGFGELTYAITDTTHLTGGLRYTHEKRSYVGQQFPQNQVPGSALFNSFSIARRTDSSSFNKLTYRIAIRQDLTDKINVYASYNRGFKSGIYSLNSAPGANPPVEPQTIDAIEAGLKSQLFDNRLRFNVAGFHYKIKNYQVRSQAPGGLGGALLLNAAVVKVDGVEAEIELAPTRGLRFNASGVYLNSRFASFPLNASFIPNPSVCVPGGNPAGTQTGPATGGNRQCFGPATGNRTPLSPKFAASLGMTYNVDVGERGELLANLTYSYSGRVFFEADNRLDQKSFGVINGALEYRPSPEWGIELWGKNITDKQYIITSTAGTTADNGLLAPPRTYGVSINFDF